MQGQELASQFTSAALVVYIIRRLRTQAWFMRIVSVLPFHSATVHRLLSVVGALAGAAGIHMAFDGNADIGWHIGFTIPPLIVMLHGVWHWVQQLALQQTLYETMGREPPPALQVAQPVAVTMIAPTPGKW